MRVIDTTRVKQEWVDAQIEEFGTMSKFAERLGVGLSTVSRWVSPQTEANGRFVGAVLNNFPVDFHDAFDVVREEVVEVRPRMRKRSTGRKVEAPAPGGAVA